LFRSINAWFHVFYEYIFSQVTWFFFSRIERILIFSNILLANLGVCFFLDHREDGHMSKVVQSKDERSKATFCFSPWCRIEKTHLRE
jgi:hypothetical protein